MSEIGKLLNNKYQLIRLVQSGGMGEVYEGLNISIDKKVAVKILKRELCSDQNKTKRFQQEAKAATQLGHPNIIEIYDFDVTSDGNFYIVEEYLEGQDVRDLIGSEGILSIKRTINIIKQVLSALSVAHEKGIIHRDIKSENIFLISKGNIKDHVKLLDFGIAKMENASLTQSGYIIGTPYFMSPEQARNSHEVTHLTDIYSVGVVMYQCLTLNLPYQKESIAEVIADLIQKKFYPKPSKLNVAVDSKLERIILKAMAFEYTKRFQSALLFIEALENYEKEMKVRLDQDGLSPTIEKSNIEDSSKGTLSQSTVRRPVISQSLQNQKKKIIYTGGVFFVLLTILLLYFVITLNDKSAQSGNLIIKNNKTDTEISKIPGDNNIDDNLIKEKQLNKLNDNNEVILIKESEISPKLNIKKDNDTKNRIKNTIISKAIKSTPVVPQNPPQKFVNSVYNKIRINIFNCNRQNGIKTGNITIDLSVLGANGKISNIKLDRFQNTSLGNCIVQKISGIQFPEFTNERFSIKKVFPLQKTDDVDRESPY